MIKINNEKNICIEVEETGAELKSLKCDGKEYLWESNPKYWKRSAPILFPIIGKLKDLETVIDGKTYQLPQHGFLRDNKFTYLGKVENEFVFESSYTNETLKCYPFKYKAYVKYYLDNNKLKTTFVIENVDNKKIAFNLGGHPAIKCPLYENESFSDYRIDFEKNENISSPKVMSDATLDFSSPVLVLNNVSQINLKKEIFNIDTIIITNVKSKYVYLRNKENKGIKFSFENFSTLAIWTPNNSAPFICLEPWQGYNDHHDTNKDFYTKDDLIYLDSGDSYQASYTIEVI